MLALPEYAAVHFNQFVAMAVVSRLRLRLLESDFSECASCFGDISSIPAQDLIRDALYFARETPPSMLHKGDSVEMRDVLLRRDQWTVVIVGAETLRDEMIRNGFPRIIAADRAGDELRARPSPFVLVAAENMDKSRRVTAELVEQYGIARVTVLQRMLVDVAVVD